MISKPLLFLIIAISLLLIVAWILLLYRRSEKEELNSISLNIFAVENGYEYLKESNELRLLLKRNKIGLDRHVEIKNIFIKKALNATIQIFDYQFSLSTSVVGLLVEFEQANFPLFDLDHKDTQTDMRDPAGFPELDSSQLPIWIANSLSVHASLSREETVANFLADKKNLPNLLQRPKPQRIYVNKKYIVVYYIGQLKNDVDKLQYLESAAMQVIDIFGNPSSIDSWEN